MVMITELQQLVMLESDDSFWDDYLFGINGDNLHKFLPIDYKQNIIPGFLEKIYSVIKNKIASYDKPLHVSIGRWASYEDSEYHRIDNIIFKVIAYIIKNKWATRQLIEEIQAEIKDPIIQHMVKVRLSENETFQSQSFAYHDSVEFH